jgi:hypothetical protein
MSKVTEEQIASWKKQHGEVFQLTGPDGRQAYISKATRKVISLAQFKMQESPISAVEVILENCWLAGDEELKEDDGFVLGVQQHINTIIETKEVEVKKL